jgi:ribosomal protein S13
LQEAGVEPSAKMKDLTDADVEKLRDGVTKFTSKATCAAR